MSAPLLRADGGWAGAAAAVGTLHSVALWLALQQPRAQLAAAPAKLGWELRQRWAAAAILPFPPPRGQHRLCPRLLLALPPPTARLFSPFLKVSNLAEQLEERLFQLYSLHNELIQERLQELAEVMERVRQAEDELQQVCHTVEAAYRDLCLQPET